MLPRNLTGATGLLAMLALATGCADTNSPTAPRVSPAEVIAPLGSQVHAAATVVVGPYTVTITDLGVPTGGTYSSGYSINNFGQVAGMSSNAANAIAPLLWNAGGSVPIPNYDPSGLLIPVRINDDGHMILNERIGGISINYAIWRQPDGTFTRIPPYPGGDSLRVTVRGLNAAGLITGVVREPNLGPNSHGVIWQNGAFFRDLGVMAGYTITDPQDINDVGSVVGNAATFSGTRAFFWQNGSFTALGPSTGASTALALNNTGTVVGTVNGGFPVRWINTVQSSLPVPAGVIQPTPVDVNDAGDIVGWGSSSAPGVLYASAFWRNGQAILLPPWPGATQTLARSINNNAEIVGEGPLVPGGPMHALKWTMTTGTPANTKPTTALVATTSTTINAGGSVSMRGSFTDPDNGPWKWKFLWRNGSTKGSTTTNGNVNATRKYTAAGTYDVRFIVTDAKGVADTSAAVTVTVR